VAFDLGKNLEVEECARMALENGVCGEIIEFNTRYSHWRCSCCAGTRANILSDATVSSQSWHLYTLGAPRPPPSPKPPPRAPVVVRDYYEYPDRSVEFQEGASIGWFGPSGQEALDCKILCDNTTASRLPGLGLGAEPRPCVGFNHCPSDDPSQAQCYLHTKRSCGEELVHFHNNIAKGYTWLGDYLPWTPETSASCKPGKDMSSSGMKCSVWISDTRYPPPAPPPLPPVKPSPPPPSQPPVDCDALIPDGDQCGAGRGICRSCCSSTGFCGSSPLHCDAGNQQEFSYAKIGEAEVLAELEALSAVQSATDKGTWSYSVVEAMPRVLSKLCRCLPPPPADGAPCNAKCEYNKVIRLYCESPCNA